MREAIVMSAMEIFSEKGYKGATTREIADHAGCNEVTLFRHFGTKETLFEEALQRFTPPSVLPKTISDRITGDVEADLKIIANEYMDAALENLPFIRMAMIEIPRNPELARLVAVLPVSMTSNVNEYFIKAHEDDMIRKADFGLLSEIFYNMLFQYVLGAYVFGAHKRGEDSREAYIGLAAGIMTAWLKG